jgi:quercetin dioxygenase-like cupin family protein
MTTPGHVPAGTKQAYRIFGDRFTFLVNSEDTGGRSCTMEVRISPNGGSDFHRHGDADEQFYILEGTVNFQLGEETFSAAPGDVVFIPRGLQHRVSTGETEARVIATFVPGGIENEFRALGEPI